MRNECKKKSPIRNMQWQGRQLAGTETRDTELVESEDGKQTHEIKRQE